MFAQNGSAGNSNVPSSVVVALVVVVIVVVVPHSGQLVGSQSPYASNYISNCIFVDETAFLSSPPDSTAHQPKRNEQK